MNIEKLTAQFRHALMESQSIALGYDHTSVEPLHLLQALLNQKRGMTVSLLSQSGADMVSLQQNLTRLLQSMPKTVVSDGDISVSRALQKLLNLSDKMAQKRGDAYIASDLFLLSAMQSSNTLGELLLQCGADVDRLSQAIESMRSGGSIQNSDESSSVESLSKYTVDMTYLAKEGKLDPVIGRDTEIRRTIQVLARRTKNNPVLIGPPGVGKTAIV